MGCGSCSTGGCGSGGCSGCTTRDAFDWLGHLDHGASLSLVDVVEVTFKAGRRGFFRNAHNLDVFAGEHVIVSADRGVDLGTVHLTGDLVRLKLKTAQVDDPHELPVVVRVATEDDMERWKANRRKEVASFDEACIRIDELGLPMKLVDSEWQFDHKKVTFFFTADGRVDFRELVRVLARSVQTRVELRQIGSRDEAGRIGGIGSCGRELCCSTWLQEFKTVTTQSARLQNLPLNPARLNGRCGRLKCCLNYELEQYMESLRRFPQVDTAVPTTHGVGYVKKLDIFKDIVWLYYPDGTWEDRALAEVQSLLNKGSTAQA